MELTTIACDSDSELVAVVRTFHVLNGKSRLLSHGSDFQTALARWIQDVSSLSLPCHLDEDARVSEDVPRRVLS